MKVTQKTSINKEGALFILDTNSQQASSRKRFTPTKKKIVLGCRRLGRHLSLVLGFDSKLLVNIVTLYLVDESILRSFVGIFS